MRESVAERSGSTPALFPNGYCAGYRRSAAATAVFDDQRPGHEYDNSWHWACEHIEPHGSTPGMSFGKRLALKRCKQKVLVEYRRGFDTFTITVNRRLRGEGLIDQRSEPTATVANDPDARLPEGGGGAHVALGRGLRLPGWNGYVWARHAGADTAGYEGRWKILISGGLTRRGLITSPTR